MKKAGVVFMMIMMAFQTNAQEFRLGEMLIEKPDQVMAGNYTGVSLPIEDGTPNANRFNPLNPYTYIQMIYDSRNTLFQLLIQTDFYGRIIYLGYSNNLSFAFDKKRSTLHLFFQCIKQVNTQFGTLQKINSLLSCILRQLNYAGDA